MTHFRCTLITFFWEFKIQMRRGGDFQLHLQLVVADTQRHFWGIGANIDFYSK